MTRKVDSPLLIGVDIGYGIVKAVIVGQQIKFPSVWGFAREIKFQSDEMARRYPGDQLCNESEWFVGELALSQLPVAEQYRLRGRTAGGDTRGNEARLLLLKAALGKLLPGVYNRDVIQVVVSTGLPVDHMRSAAALKKVFIGRHLVQTDQAEFIADVQAVYVMPQPYGTVYDQTLTTNGDVNASTAGTTRIGVVDVGTYTIDVLLSKDLEFIDAASGSVEGGVHTAQERIAAVLESEYADKFDVGLIDNLLRTGELRAYGQAQDYRQEVAAALEPLRAATANLANDKWHSGATIDVIYLSGGGAPLVADVIMKQYPQASLVEDPQFANARGYLRYAQFRNGETGSDR